MSRIALSKDNFKVVEVFAVDMSASISELCGVLREAFDSFRNGECSEQIKSVTLNLFDEWLTRSLLPRVGETTDFIVQLFAKTDDIEEIKGILAKTLRNFVDIENVAVQIAADKARGTNLEEAVRKYIWTIYSQHVEAFIVQTAHLIVGRILLHLVGTDKRGWTAIQVQQGVPVPYVSFYWFLRSTMSALLPSIYFLNELDWLYVSGMVRQRLKPDQTSILKLCEERIDRVLGRTYIALSKYDYSLVDMDIWKVVYQRFLPPEEINKLGFVTTPDEIVDLILDLAGYKEDLEGLCFKSMIDPACGSGTFLVEALVRLRRHFEADLSCHKRQANVPIWEWEKDLLERVILNIHGIDIHPFATFLTTMNLTFQLIDIYSRVKHKYSDFALSMSIVTHDALAEKPVIQSMGLEVNSRLAEATERSKKYAEVYEKEFDFVVGNPPWGAVLRGAIGPLGDEERRRDYTKRFRSATGKFDIFVLFMERGIKWLKKGGVMGMITQVAYVSQAFGKGIQKVMKEEGTPKCFVDLSALGHLIFPRWTNYPAITVLEKGAKGGDVTLVEARET